MKTPSFESQNNSESLFKPSKYDYSNMNNYDYHLQNISPNSQFLQYHNQETSYLSKRIKDLEIELQAANTRYDEMKDKLTKKLHSETNRRKVAEEQCMTKIEEHMTKENQLKRLQSNSSLKLEEYESKIEDLENKIAILEETYKTMKTTSESQITTLRKQLNTKDEQFTKEINELRNTNETLQNQMNKINDLTEEENKSINEQEKTNQQLKNTMYKYMKNNNALKRQLQDFQTIKHNEQQEQLYLLKEQFANEKNTLYNEYQNKFKVLENEKEEGINNYNKVSEELKQQHKLLLTSKLKLEKELADLKNENLMLNKDNDNQIEKYDTHKKELERKDELIVNYRNQLNQLKLDVQNNFNETNKQVSNLEREYNNCKVDWEQERQVLLEQIDTLKTSNNTLKQENEKLQNLRKKFKEDAKKYIKKLIDDKLSNISE